MSERLDRVGDLLGELKSKKENAVALQQQIASLKIQLQSKECEVQCLAADLIKSREDAKFLKWQNTASRKRTQFRMKGLENEVRKGEAFTQKLLAVSKTKREQLMVHEMDELRKVNKTLLGFVEALGRKFDFDCEVVKTLAGIANGVDDRILQLYLDGLRQNVNQEDVPVNEVVVNK